MAKTSDDRTVGHGAQGDVEELSRILGAYNSDVGTQGRLGLFSAHKAAEDVCMRLLNELYGWSLENRNAPGRNEEAVDLVDDENRIVVQVTATCSRDKINHTLDSPQAATYHERGYRLKFAFVGFQHDARKVQGTGHDAWTLHDPHGAGFFDRHSDALFSADLVARFQGFDPASRARVLDLARADIGTVRFAEGPRAAEDPVAFAERINATIVRQRDNHPSFHFIGTRANDFLHPRGTPHSDYVGGLDPATRNWTGTARGESIPLERFFRDSWAGEQCHLLITGKGGIGKTVALLTFATKAGFLPQGVPAVYVSLRDLVGADGGGCERIDSYLKRAFDPADSERIVDLSREEWYGGPRVILLLDGFNEVPKERRKDVESDISEWATMRRGVQLVTSSRIRCLAFLRNVRWIELRGLTRAEIEGYLQGRGLSVPVRPRGNDLWRVLDTPLMLKIYADVELFVKFFSSRTDTKWLDMRSPLNAGNLIWNYIQMELFGCMVRRKGNYNEAVYACAIMLSLPYVCWRMEAAQSFRMGRDELHGYIEEAARYWGGRDAPEYFGHMCWDLTGEVGDASAKAAYEILADETCLLVWGDDEAFSLMHQNFRDGLAAIYVRNAVDACARGLPDVLVPRLSERVRGYVADLYAGDDDSPLLRAWEANRALRPTHQDPTHNLLGILHKLRKGDLSGLDWSGMDLRGISLFGYRDGMELKVSREPASFDGTRLDLGCFRPIGHSAAVTAIRFSQDGKTLASGSLDGTIRIWDSSTREQVGEPIDVPGGAVRSIAFSPDGSILASGSEDGCVRIWDVSSHELLGKSERSHGGRVHSVRFSKKGSFIASGSRDGTIRIWDAATCERVGEPMNGQGGVVRSISFSPDDRLLASGSRDGLVRIWDATTRQLAGPPLDGHGGAVHSIDFSGREPLLAVASFDGFVRVWDVGIRELLCELDCGSWVLSVRFSLDGRLIASGSDGGTICLWDVDTRKRLGEPLIRVGGAADSVALSPHGHQVAGGFTDGSICVWDMATRELVGPPIGGGGNAITSVCCSPTRGIAAIGSYDGALRLWDVESRRQLGSPMRAHNGWITSVRFAVDGSLVVSGSSDGTVCLWDVESQRRLGKAMRGHRGPVKTVGISPDRSLVVSGSEDSTIRIWDVGTFRQIGAPITVGGCKIHTLGIDGGGTMVVGGLSDGTIRTWDVNTGRMLANPIQGHGGPISHVRISAGNALLAAGLWNGDVSLWDAVSHKPLGKAVEGREVAERIGRPAKGGYPPAICFSPDGGLLAIGTFCGDVSFWDTTRRCLDGKPIQLYDVGRIRSLGFTNDGRYVVCGAERNAVQLLDAKTRRLVDQFEVLGGIDLSGLDLTCATIEDDHDRKVLYQNGAMVPGDVSGERHEAAVPHEG